MKSESYKYVSRFIIQFNFETICFVNQFKVNIAIKTYQTVKNEITSAEIEYLKICSSKWIKFVLMAFIHYQKQFLKTCNISIQQINLVDNGSEKEKQVCQNTFGERFCKLLTLFATIK